MLKKFGAWFRALSTAGKAGFIAAVCIVGVAAASSGAPNNQTATKQTQTKPKTAATCTGTVTYNTVTQSVPYQSSTVNDDMLAQGKTEVTTQGVDGEEQIKHQLTNYSPSGCKQDTDVVISTTVSKQPVTQVTSVGTYVAPAPSTTPSCTNGTYVNSAGNTVCSPETSPTAPAGATAQCVDGTYSFSQSRSGTCSHHGGVAQWLN